MRGFRLIDNCIPMDPATTPLIAYSRSQSNDFRQPSPSVGMPNFSYTTYSTGEYNDHHSRPLSGPLNRILRSAGFADRMPATWLIRSLFDNRRLRFVIPEPEPDNAYQSQVVKPQSLGRRAYFSILFCAFRLLPGLQDAAIWDVCTVS
jgi:hypothetical protein